MGFGSRAPRGVPINEYPTRRSFAQALVAFGSMVERVALLSELSGPDEAMLLYDATVAGQGQMRIAEHFTVSNDRIVCLRQIHDTVAIRAAGWAREQLGASPSSAAARTGRTTARPECGR